MSKFVLTTTEPTITVTVPVRFLPQLVAILAAAVTPAAKPCVETTCEPAPSSRPALAKVQPLARTLRKVG